MTATASTLRTFRIGGQLDPAWSTTIPWANVRATAALSLPSDGSPILDPSNNAHEHPLVVSNTLTAATSGGQWCTAALKPTTAPLPANALQPTGLYWVITVALQWETTWQNVATYSVLLDGTRNYSGLGETITVAGNTCVDIVNLTAPPSTTVVTTNTTMRVLVWDGSNWVPDTTVAVYIQRTGDPTPTGLSSNDIVLKQ